MSSLYTTTFVSTYFQLNESSIQELVDSKYLRIDRSPEIMWSLRGAVNAHTANKSRPKPRGNRVKEKMKEVEEETIRPLFLQE